MGVGRRIGVSPTLRQTLWGRRKKRRYTVVKRAHLMFLRLAYVAAGLVMAIVTVLPNSVWGGN